MSTPRKRTTKAAPKGGKGSNYNVLAAVGGSAGAPPLSKLLKGATGKDVRSVVLRVDLDFAHAVRKLAGDSGRTITSVTRELLTTMGGS
jgi:hypothetical protein